MKKILIIEDDLEIVKLLELYLKKEGFIVNYESNGLEGYKLLLNENYDVALVDIMLPMMNGYEIIEEIRKKKDTIIIVISAKSEFESKILGLDLGADDYITKPFNPLEVVARIKANLRRINKDLKVINYQNLKMDILNSKVYLDDEEINLTATEFKLLKILLSSQNQIFSKEKLCELLYGYYYENDENSIIVHIFNLREKIKDTDNKIIKNVRGMGYKIEKES